MTDTLTLRRPDDWHLHLRDGAMLQAVTPHSSDFGRVLVMPNLVPPVVTTAQASAYLDRIRAAIPQGSALQPQMTLYLTEASDPADIIDGHRSGLIRAVKLYPAGATTNSDSGVRNFDRVRPVLEAMAEAGMPLCVHGEVTDPAVDIFDREAVFLDRVLDPVRRATPGLRIVLEHVTTRQGLDYIRGNQNIAGTITAHHLAINRNHMLVGGIRPHYYCLPILKREEHRRALLDAATGGENCFFLGTDSAPHPDHAKESACGCAGCFTAPITMPLLAQLFEAEGALDRLEGFTALHGAAFYGLPPAEDRIRLVKRATSLDAPDRIEAGGETVTLFDPGFPIHWHVEKA